MTLLVLPVSPDLQHRVLRQLLGLEPRAPLRSVGQGKLPAEAHYESKLVVSRGVSPKELYPAREVYPYSFFDLQPQLPGFVGIADPD